MKNRYIFLKFGCVGFGEDWYGRDSWILAILLAKTYQSHSNHELNKDDKRDDRIRQVTLDKNKYF